MIDRFAALHRNETVKLLKPRVWRTLFLAAVLMTACAVCALPHTARAAGASHLAEGIRLYRGGSYDEALYEFKTVIDTDPRCPLAYYYAALIRVQKEQYSRAVTNSEAALEDSADFNDARGLLAFALNKMGRKNEAIAEWRRFVAAVKTMEDGSEMTVESIMLPDDYRHKRMLEAEEAKRRRMGTGRRAVDMFSAEAPEEETMNGETGAEEKIPAGTQSADDDSRGGAFGVSDNTGAIDVKRPLTASDTAGGLSSLLAAAGADTPAAPGAGVPLDDLDRRVRSNIRKGFWGLAALVVIAGAGAFAAMRLVRRKRVRKEETVFSEEVERILSDRTFERDEEKTLREFEARKREITETLGVPEEIPAAPDMRETPEQPRIQPAVSEKPVPLDRGVFIPETMRKSHITEEVKTLVSRLHREGRSAADIANIADLTRTEVELILAVREHYMESLIEEVTGAEEPENRDQFLKAVYGLSAEGASVGEIAKKLNISTSEVRLASRLLEMRRRG